jgi:DNA-binding NarL/FixJ family response regulator
MFGFLIIEDNIPTLESLKVLLADEFPEFVIDCAQSASEAEEFLKTTHERGVIYKIALIDFELPHRRGETPTVEQGMPLRRRVLEATNEQTVVIHVTAHLRDDRIITFIMNEQLRHPHSARPIVISKGNADWFESLLSAIRETVYGGRIRERMDRLFGEELSSASPYRFRAEPANADTTQELAALAADIESHWQLLDDKLRERISQTFRIEQAGKSVTVDLL